MKKTAREILKQAIDGCFDCAEKGEATMCEQGKLFDKCKVVDQVLSELHKLIMEEMPKEWQGNDWVVAPAFRNQMAPDEGDLKIWTYGYNTARKHLETKLEEIFNQGGKG